MALDSVEDIKTEPSRKRMTIFRNAEGTSLQDCMPFVGVDDSVMAGFAKMSAAGAADAHAERTVCLFKSPGENGLSLCYGWFKSNYVLPKHSHNADCVYYVTGGELHTGSAVLQPGDGIFVPADHAYTFTAGPEGVEFIEFRNASEFHIHFKGNDEAHWDKLANCYRDNKDAWAKETVPPSQR